MTIPAALAACLLVGAACGATAAEARSGGSGSQGAAVASPGGAGPAAHGAHFSGSVPKLRIGAPVAYFDDRAPTRVVQRIVEREPDPPADPFAFENLPVRTGIRPPPTPNPTIYRIGGQRARPAIRVIEVNRTEPEGGVRGRFRDPPTGAVVIFVDQAQPRLAR